MRTSYTRVSTFEAAHVVPRHPGKCSRLHGHNYRLDVTIEESVRPDGVVIDLDRRTLDSCIHLCKKRPRWRLTVRQHEPHGIL